MNINLKERIAGLLYGVAIGDALGLGTELMTRRVAEKKYPNGLTDYSQSVRDAHRSQWTRGDWSNDTNYVLELIDSICECEEIDHTDYAHRLAKLYDNCHDDFTTHMRWVLSQKDYPDNPFEVARRVWRDMKEMESPSDALGRALIIGVWTDNIRENAIKNCRLTHPTTRCETSAILIAYMANSILWQEHEVPYDVLHDIVKQKNIETLDYLETAHDGKLEDFGLDNMSNFFYVRKAMGAALWALWHCDNPNEALLKIVNQAGDADTNASLAVGLLGLKYGVKALDPKYIDNLIGKERIDEAVEKLTALLQKKFVN